jgi:hypothetical protein
MSKSAALLLVVPTLAAAGAGCRRAGATDQDQLGAAVGEVMASIDESTSGSGATAQLLPILRTPDALRTPRWQRLFDLVPPVYAASCWQSAFAACASGVRTRTFDACTIGPSTLTGSVSLTFSDSAACTIAGAGESVHRMADFTLTGPYGGTLAVTSTGGGQTLTRTATGFEYTVQGMQRVLTGPGGRTLFDVSTRTTSPIAITGSSRADLVIASGALEVSHNLAGYKVTFVPENLAWSPTCNCAVSGRLTGTVQGGGSKLDGKSASIDLMGCGHADVSIDGDTESVTLDRCAGN